MHSDTDSAGQVLGFYSRHPISAAHILARLQAVRGNLDGVTPQELFPHDQDHYGGLAANDALATRAGLAAGQHVVDFCAGLGGPARYYAAHYGVTVTGIEINPDRVSGAARLTRLVGLQDSVTVLDGDVRHTRLSDACADVVLSQEALLHVPDRPAVFTEAARLLRPGGRLAVTDWLAHRPLRAADTDSLWRGMAVRQQCDLATYRAQVERAGLRVLSVEDLSAEWGPVLEARFAMYRALRAETLAAGNPAGDDDFYASYARLVALVQDGTLGGVRLAAVR